MALPENFTTECFWLRLRVSVRGSEVSQSWHGLSGSWNSPVMFAHLIHWWVSCLSIFVNNMSRNVSEISAFRSKNFELNLKVTPTAETLQLSDGFSDCGDDVTRAISRSTTKTNLLDGETHSLTDSEWERDGGRGSGGLRLRILLSTNVIDTDDRPASSVWMTRFTWPMNKRNERELPSVVRAHSHSHAPQRRRHASYPSSAYMRLLPIFWL